MARPALRRILTAAMCVGALLAASGSANAFELAKTSAGQPVHWKYNSVHFTVDRAIDETVSGGADAVANVLPAWSKKVGGPEMSAAVEKTKAKPGYDRINSITFAKSGYAPAGNALAVTILTFDDSTGEILDADIVFNGIHQFGTTLDSVDHGEPIPNEGTKPIVTKYPFDFVHVGAHELGHSLGLGDEKTSRDSLMYGYTKPGILEKRAPTNDDLVGLSKIYGGVVLADPTAEEAGGCHMSDSRAIPMGGLALMALTLGGVVMASRSRHRAKALLPIGLGLLGLGASGPGAPPVFVEPLGDARVSVTRTESGEEDGVFYTDLTVETETCRMSNCPRSSTARVWGGRRGNIVQQVGPWPAPAVGDVLEVSMATGAAPKVLVDARHGGR